MKKSLIFTILIPVIMIISTAPAMTNPEKGLSKAPPVQGTNLTLNGGIISLNNYIGEVVLVNFWATWCPPCRHEIPDLIKLQDTYKGKLIVLGISVDKNSSGYVKKFAVTNGINYPVIMGDNGLLAEYGGIESIPTTFLVDTNGYIAKKFIGSMDFAQYAAEIKPYLP